MLGNILQPRATPLGTSVCSWHDVVAAGGAAQTYWLAADLSHSRKKVLQSLVFSIDHGPKPSGCDDLCWNGRMGLKDSLSFWRTHRADCLRPQHILREAAFSYRLWFFCP